MATNGGQLRTPKARQACFICKNRKKKCNRLLPSCAYCVRKDLDCVYAQLPQPRTRAVTTNDNAVQGVSVNGARPHLNLVSSRMILSALSPSAEAHQLSCPFYHRHGRDQESPSLSGGIRIELQDWLIHSSNQVYHEVHRLVRATGQFVDSFSAHYFRGFHSHLPIISRIRFSSNLITSKAVPSADLSILLLTICLITQAPALGYCSEQGDAPAAERQSLYLTARSLLAQVQVACPPSLCLIQAGILIAVYEYLHGRPDDAFVTLASCTRLAYAARIHTNTRHETQMISATNHDVEVNSLLEAEEARNTWWGLVICERMFYTELAIFDQPLSTAFPGGDGRLPIEPQILDQLDVLDPESIPNILVSCMTSPKIGGFGRTAQAVCLLDQVLKGVEVSDIDSRLLLLDRLDSSIQAFLSLVMPLCRDQLGIFCVAMNIAIRALFLLHEHILYHPQQTVRADLRSLEDWHQKSKRALGTVTKMVVDIAESLVDESPGSTALLAINAVPPTYPYIARAALKHLRSSADAEDLDWLGRAKQALQTSLDKYFRRWGVTAG